MKKTNVCAFCFLWFLIGFVVGIFTVPLFLDAQTTDQDGQDFITIDRVTDMVFCDACGKCMTMPDSITTAVGMEITIHTQLSDSTESKKWNNFIDEQLGQYSGRRNFKICYECWLKSLGVIPIEFLKGKE